MYFVFVIKTKHKSVSGGSSKITRKEIPKLFSWEQPSQFAEMYIARQIDEIVREEGNREKDDGF